jgi:hypothetical protein
MEHTRKAGMIYLNQTDCAHCEVGKISVSFDFEGVNPKPATTQILQTCDCHHNSEERVMLVAHAAAAFYNQFGKASAA